MTEHVGRLWEPTHRRHLKAFAAALIFLALLVGACDSPSSSDPLDSNDATESTQESQSAAAEPTEAEPSEPVAAFRPIRLHGRGNAVENFEIPEETAAISEIAHQGTANFAVWTLDSAGTQQDLLVNTIGNYQGTVLFDEQQGQHTAAFEIEADGAWTIRVLPVTRAPKWAGNEPLTGHGDGVILLTSPPEGLTTTTIRHDGRANFAVWAYGDTTELLVNEIGRYNGESLVPAGTLVFEITADGDWRFSPLE
jgi:hypothetical protein